MRHVINGEVEPEDLIEFFLLKDYDSINLMARRTGQAQFYIARINPDGTLHRYQGVPPELGLPLDSLHRVKDDYTE